MQAADQSICLMTVVDAVNTLPKKYHSVEAYKKASESLHAVSGLLLFEFARHNCSKKDLILRNFIARAAKSLQSIQALWELEDYQNAWVIHRTMLDRLFHLHSIGAENAFEEFDDWSFFEQIRSQNRLKSDPVFKNEAVGWSYELSPDQKARIKTLEKNKPSWRRPKAKSVAKKMDMHFLYKYGYDFASKFVHPMSDDGYQDFISITRSTNEKFPSHIAVLSNSVLAATMIVQEALNLSSFKWRKMVWDFLHEVRWLLDKGDESYEISFIKIAKSQPQLRLCEKIEDLI